MKQSKLLWIASLMLLLLPCTLPAAESTRMVQLKAGEMALLPFLDMVSEKLDTKSTPHEGMTAPPSQFLISGPCVPVAPRPWF